MARRQSANKGDIIPEGEEEETLKPDLVNEVGDTSDIENIQLLLANEELEGGKIRLERKGAGDSRWQYCTTMPVSDFDRDTIASNWGGGDYKFRTFRANGQMFKQGSFSIDYRIKGKLDSQPIIAQDNTAKVIESVIRMMPQDKSVDVMRDMMANQQKQAENNMTLLITMMNQSAERQTMMLTEMMKQSRQTGPDPTTAWMPLMLKMIESKSSDGKSSTSMTELFELMTKVKEFTGGDKQVEREEKEESPMLKLFTAAAPLLGAVLGGRTGPIQPTAASGAPPPELQPPPTPSPADNPMIRAFLGQLVVAAKRDSDPMAYVIFIENALGPDQIASVRQQLTADNWFDLLFGASAAQHIELKPWFERLREHLLSEPDGDTPPSADGPAPTPAAASV